MKILQAQKARSVHWFGEVHLTCTAARDWQILHQNLEVANKTSSPACSLMNAELPISDSLSQRGWTGVLGLHHKPAMRGGGCSRGPALARDLGPVLFMPLMNQVKIWFN